MIIGIIHNFRADISMLVIFAQFINKSKLFIDYFVNMNVFYNNLKLFYKIYPVSKYKKASQIYILRRFEAAIEFIQSY